MELVAKFINALGGTSEVSRELGITPGAVSNWKARNEVPEHVYRRLRDLAHRKGIVMNEAIFGGRQASGTAAQ